jgi:hypothetical protein
VLSSFPVLLLLLQMRERAELAVAAVLAVLAVLVAGDEEELFQNRAEAAAAVGHHLGVGRDQAAVAAAAAEDLEKDMTN